MFLFAWGMVVTSILADNVLRPMLIRGAEELGVPFEEHVGNVIEGLKTVRGVLGL